MRKTTNYGLVLYDSEDKMSITAEENSLNATMELIDSALKEKTTIEDMTTYIENHKDELKGADGKDGTNGTNGKDGTNGQDGYSPIAKVETTSTGATITITDKNGTTKTTVTNGKDGVDGAKGDKGDKGDTGSQGVAGKDGADGVGISSVTQTTTSTADGGTNVITVTKTDGTTSTFFVKNGSKGSTGATGPQGEQGIQGPKGDKGDTGATGQNGTDGKTPVKGVDYFTQSDKDTMIGEVKTDLTNYYGTVFNKFPTEAQIIALPNHSYFSVKVGQGITDADNRMTTYYRTTDWRGNALKYTGTDGKTIYVVPVGQAVDEMYLPDYGIKTGKKNATSNSEIMANLVGWSNYATTYKLPSGHFYFSEPLDISGKQISLIGEVNASFKNSAQSGTTWLHFEDLVEGEIALTVSQCTLANFTIHGNQSQYSIEVNRDNSLTDVNTVFTETAEVKATGIKATATINIRNVGFRNFYQGCTCNNANIFVQNASFEQCHYGLTIGTDTKVHNIWGVDVMVLLQITGSLSSVIGARGDSIGKHLIEITSGWGIELYDIDADFCMGAIVSVGKDNHDGNSSVRDLIVSGIKGRANVNQMFPTASSPVPERNANHITDSNSSDFGVIHVKNGSTLTGALITTNQPDNYSTPFDIASDYSFPFVLLSAGTGSIATDINFISTAKGDNILTADWVKKRVGSLSQKLNACDVTIQTSKGSIKYIKDNGIETIIDDATDIYNRMDKSKLALSAEVVKTVNGIQPDDDGNVTVTQQEPEVVGSASEFTDTSKKYVLDNYIYAYRKKFIKGETTPNFTSQLPISKNPLNPTEILEGVGYKQKARYTYNWDTNKIEEKTQQYDDIYSTGVIPIKTGDVIRINNLGYYTNLGYDVIAIVTNVTTGNMGISGITPANLSKITAGGGKYTTTGTYANGLLDDVEIHVNNATFGWLVNNSNTINYYLIVASTDRTPPDNVIITVNEEISYTVTQDRYEWNWENTGEPYNKPDYLSMINSLEERVKALENA